MDNKSIRIYDGAVAIITGGASGIGRALAEELSRQGCEVVVADLQVELAEEVTSQICANGGKASFFEVDVCDYHALEEVVKKTYARTGRLDYMFNNVGIGVGGEVRSYSIEDWNRVFNVNLRSVANGIQASYPIMIAQGFGHIINTASVAGLLPTPFLVAYSATKHAIVGLSKSLRTEAAYEGIRVSVLCPGVIRTPILDGGGKFGKMPGYTPPELKQRIIFRFKPSSADTFAGKVLKKVAKNRAIIVVPGWWKFPWLMNRMFPRFGIYVAGKSFQRSKDKLKQYRAAKARSKKK
jgi:NAD(P)-dependent dehydrogenase (short-subunit alcohol dehydrogenase family)